MKKTPSISNDLLDDAIAYVKSGRGLDDVTETIVGLTLPIGGEEADARAAQVRHIVRLLEAYQVEAKVERPLSIVVFGPPGSGKSRFVKKITGAIKGCTLVKTVNLTQIANKEELAGVFKSDEEPKDPTVTPVYFFDEFDAARDGVPLGWLSWFLAPMQDGVVLVDGKEQEVRKAVFMFAGGTADTLDEFNQRAQLDPETYRARKVPDFVSRLRGAINIGGVNGVGDARIVPRALALQHFLKDNPERLSDERIRQFLSNGHFVHSMRSMETLLNAGWSETGEIDLPEAIRRQHFSRGELDGQVVGISAGLKETDSDPMLPDLTMQLLRSGATLAYAGAFFPKGTLEQVRTAARDAPPELVAGTDRGARVRNYLGYPASLRDTGDAEKDVDFIRLGTIGASELEVLGAPTDDWFAALPQEPGGAYDPRRHVAWALSLFRLRVRVLQDVSALVVLGGKDDGLSWGRMAGIAEEVMIALALGKPVFVLGGAGGAAHAVGQLLGLDEAPVSLDQCLKPAAFTVLNDALAPYASSFEIPGEPDSPRTLADLRRFLFHRGVTTPGWPWNGLSLAENRELFTCPISQGRKSVDRAVGLIMQGLSRIDWKPAGGGRDPVREGDTSA